MDLEVLIASAQAWGPRLVAALLVAALTMFVAGRLQRLVEGLTRRARGPASLGELLGRAVGVAALVLGGFVVLNVLQLGPAVFSFIAGLGIVGLILGFALQDIARQFASGVLLLTLRPFEVGDEIRVKDFQGAVADVRLLTVVLRSDDGREILIPNADVYINPIVNFSRYGLQRNAVVLTLPAGEGLEAARARLLGVLRGLEGVAAEPPPELVLTEILDAGVRGEARFWVNHREHNATAVRSAAVAALTAGQSTKGNAESAATDEKLM
jgi:small-conductance mechanosensitive channel